MHLEPALPRRRPRYKLDLARPPLRQHLAQRLFQPNARLSVHVQLARRPAPGGLRRQPVELHPAPVDEHIPQFVVQPRDRIRRAFHHCLELARATHQRGFGLPARRYVVVDIELREGPILVAQRGFEHVISPPVSLGARFPAERLAREYPGAPAPRTGVGSSVEVLVTQPTFDRPKLL